MNLKSTSTAFKTILGGLFFTTLITVGCNSGEEKKEAAPAETTTPAAPASDSGAAKMDTTAATKPVVTPN
jgi:hypothetical protein